MLTLKFKLSVPVTVAMASVDGASACGDRLVLAPQDDSAYNKHSAQHALTVLDVRIGEVEEQRTAYEERRDLAAAAREKLVWYQVNYGSARLRQAAAEIELHEIDEQAAQSRQQEFTLQADQAQNLARQLAAQAAPMPERIGKLKIAIQRIEDFQRDWEYPLVSKRDRLAEVQGLLDAKQHQLDDLERQRGAAEEQRGNAMEDRLRHEREARDLASERGQIAHRDATYPADEQLRTNPRGIETLRGTYADAVSTLQTQERDRLGVLAEKLENARHEYKKATSTSTPTSPI